jgi:hypothetical protein
MSWVAGCNKAHAGAMGPSPGDDERVYAGKKYSFFGSGTKTDSKLFTQKRKLRKLS